MLQTISSQFCVFWNSIAGAVLLVKSWDRPPSLCPKIRTTKLFCRQPEKLDWLSIKQPLQLSLFCALDIVTGAVDLHVLYMYYSLLQTTGLYLKPPISEFELLLFSFDLTPTQWQKQDCGLVSLSLITTDKFKLKVELKVWKYFPLPHHRDLPG